MSKSVSTVLFHGQNVTGQVRVLTLVVFNKHNTARVASCWFIIYYRVFYNLQHKDYDKNLVKNSI